VLFLLPSPVSLVGLPPPPVSLVGLPWALGRQKDEVLHKVDVLSRSDVLHKVDVLSRNVEQEALEEQGQQLSHLRDTSFRDLITVLRFSAFLRFCRKCKNCRAGKG